MYYKACNSYKCRYSTSNISRSRIRHCLLPSHHFYILLSEPDGAEIRQRPLHLGVRIAPNKYDFTVPTAYSLALAVLVLTVDFNAADPSSGCRVDHSECHCLWRTYGETSCSEGTKRHIGNEWCCRCRQGYSVDRDITERRCRPQRANQAKELLRYLPVLCVSLRF